MITYFVNNSYVAIVYGAVALVCQIQFAASMRPAEVTLLSSVSTSSMLHDHSRELLQVFYEMNNFLCKPYHITSTGVNPCAWIIVSLNSIAVQLDADCRISHG